LTKIPSLLACALLAIGLSACATTYAPQTAHPAKVRDGRLIRSWFDWDTFWVSQIDGLPISQRFFSRPEKIDAGHHLILIFHKGNRPDAGFVSAGYLSTVANLAANKNYDVAATESSGVVRVWIRDIESGKPVSEVVERPVMPLQSECNSIVVPVFLPRQ